MTEQIRNTLAALYVSEIWYTMWQFSEQVVRPLRKRRMYFKTRALVVFDRVLNERFE